MTREDITRMAREAGFVGFDGENKCLREFAALVVAAERERIKEANAPEIEKVNTHIKALEDAVAAEREACAKVCESAGPGSGPVYCAFAIRAIK